MTYPDDRRSHEYRAGTNADWHHDHGRPNGPGPHSGAAPAAAHPGYGANSPDRMRGPRPSMQPRDPSRPGLLEFVRRDPVAMAGALAVIVAGILLFVTPHLTWGSGHNDDFGTVSVTGTGSMKISRAAEAGLDTSDRLDLATQDTMAQMLAEPLVHMLGLAALLIVVGGLLMLTTARRLGIGIALAGCIPPTLLLMFTALGSGMSSDGISLGVGVYGTFVLFVVVIVGSAVVATRPEFGPLPRPRGRRPDGPRYGGPQDGPRQGDPWSGEMPRTEQSRGPQSWDEGGRPDAAGGHGTADAETSRIPAPHGGDEEAPARPHLADGSRAPGGERGEGDHATPTRTTIDRPSGDDHGVDGPDER